MGVVKVDNKDDFLHKRLACFDLTLSPDLARSFHPSNAGSWFAVWVGYVRETDCLGRQKLPTPFRRSRVILSQKVTFGWSVERRCGCMINIHSRTGSRVRQG